ncbi:uncharacterized protein LOC141689873 isoform X2 [Apium graveolens]|uniref:uncharacterized protein LOC141689873 isoform X2 n=1 Tax=Apium graveolens TaxID=4045 RepID=UPI003D792F25
MMVIVLKKLTNGAILSPSEAAEEFRGGVLRCFRALLLSLHMCSKKSCSCKQITGWPALSKSTELQSPISRDTKYDSEQECLLAFLQSQTASPAVGHWLSLLLKAADTEAGRGQLGSAQLRTEAFFTLRILVAKVGTADALSFFVPGVVSQFGKVLHVAKRMISGAAGSAESLDQAIRGLAEFLMIVLEDNADLCSLDETGNGNAGVHSSKEKSPQSILEELRHLPVSFIGQSQIVVKDLKHVVVDGSVPDLEHKNEGTKSQENVQGTLHVDRTKDWILKTSAHVDKLLSATFPNLCVHPAQKVRKALLAAIEGLLSRCYYTLKESRLVFLECLFVLVCDDFEEVSEAAQVFLGGQFSSRGKHDIKHDVAQIFSRLTKKLPNVVLGSEEAVAISHAQKLLVLIYFSGPRLVKDHFLQSPVTAAQFLDSFALCLGQNSAFAGSLQNLMLARPSSTGYLHSIAEMKAVNSFSIDDNSIKQAFSSKEPRFLGAQNNKPVDTWENVHSEVELPRVPPWFVHVGSHKLYQTLARILRLVGLSLLADSRSEASLSVVADIPLGYIRKLVSEIRTKSYSKESWKSWYHRTGSGRLVRQASVAACILNEMIYGLSDQAINSFSKMFNMPSIRWEEVDGSVMVDDYYMQRGGVGHTGPDETVWRFCQKDGRSHLIDCVGSVLHEYLCSEIWDLPSAKQDFVELSDIEDGDITLHFFRDNAMMHQVVIDGIGIFNMCLGGDFTSCGFLHSSLYVLLENLICSDFQTRSASDAVLHVIAATSGYPTVGHLVVDNSDYIIDFVCQQLRHLDLNPNVPSVLAAMLSYIGAAHNILPLLEEPMRSVSLELEILGRHQHPELTIPFLKAVAEIVKASKREAVTLCSQAESYLEIVKSKKCTMENEIKCGLECSVLHDHNNIGATPVDCGKQSGDFVNNVDAYMEEVESMLLTLNDFRRYRRTVGSIVGSCVTAVTPLLISAMQVASLVAFDIIEDGILALAKVEVAYKDEKQTMGVIEEIVDLYSRYDLKDALDADENVADENRLLPAMNKIWPFLVSCFKSGNQLAVRKCSAVISSSVQVCGGDFFSRRFYTDGGHFWKLLNTSPFKKKPFSKQDKAPLQLPYRSTLMASEGSMAEVSDMKVQVAVLNMIGDISRNKRSASALDAVLKKVSGIVVGIACSGVTGLRDASINALAGLASIDPDLVWLLLADVYYSAKKSTPSQPSADFPKIHQILPPPPSTKSYLYVQYGGQSYGFDIDFYSVEIVFKKLRSQVFISQFHI